MLTTDSRENRTFASRTSTVVAVGVVLLIVALAGGAVGTAASADGASDAGQGYAVQDESDNETVSFVASSQGGFVAFSEETVDDARSEGVDFPVKAEGEAPIQIVATVDGTTWESTETDFPELHVQGDLYADVEAPNGLSGEIDPETGRVTAEGELNVTIAGESFAYQIAATSETSNDLQGSADLEAEPAEVTLVDNEFTVSDTTGGVIDRALDLPADSEGENWFELVLEIDFEGDDLQEYDDPAPEDDQDDEDETVDLALTVAGQAFAFVGLAGAVIFILISLVARFTGLVSLEK